jgi:hypothetical protein
MKVCDNNANSPIVLDRAPMLEAVDVAVGIAEPVLKTGGAESDGNVVGVAVCPAQVGVAVLNYSLVSLILRYFQEQLTVAIKAPILGQMVLRLGNAGPVYENGQ